MCWAVPCNINTIEMNFASSWCKKFSQQVETSRFASTVGANQRMDVSALDAQCDVVDCNEATKLFGEPLRLKNNVAHADRIRYH